MKTNTVKLAAAIAMSQFLVLGAFAQSTSSTTSAAPQLDGAAPIMSSVAEAPAAKSKVGINYLGIMHGNALSNEFEGQTYEDGGKDIYLNNRPAIKYSFTENVDLGLQARFNVRFQKDGLDLVNDPWRIFSNVKNVYKDDVFQFNLLNRIILPTRLKDHNVSMLPSPEFLPILNITPKNSRFNLSVYPQLIRYLHSDAAASAKAVSFVALGNFEATYQLSGSAALTFGFYPEYVATKQSALNNDSNELDLGVSFEVAKGWAINPFIAAEFVGMGAGNSAASKNMALNMVLTGALL